MQTQDRITFIKELQIDSPPPQLKKLAMKRAKPRTDDKSASVDAGSLISFVAGVSSQNKEDILNSCLLAQLASNKQFDRWKQTDDWYKFYVEVLGKVGWVMQEFKFTRSQISGTTVKVYEVLLKLLASIATQNQIAVVMETLDALKALKDEDGKLVLFDTQSQDMGKGNFQIGVVSEANNTVAMTNAAFHFSSTETVTRFLWFQYATAKTSIFQAAQTQTLNGQVYNKVRQAVLDKLGTSAETYVGDLEI
jgi:hypothetical protein